MLNATSTPWAPWHVVPADHKWFAHIVIADTLVRKLRSLKLEYPASPPLMKKAIREAKKRLERE
jgi:hypothetical protein